MRPAVFLDRDGVLFEAIVRDGRPRAPESLAQVRYASGVGQALEALRHAGYFLIVVTNQPDVGRGLLRREVVEAMHADLRRRLPVDDIQVCYHVEEDGCGCRKPKPGMLHQAAKTWGVDLARSVMVGDRWGDMEAGRAAGCKTILLQGQYDERPAEAPDGVVRSLAEASQMILSTWGRPPRAEALHART